MPPVCQYDPIYTRRAYLAAVTGLAKHYQQSPETITKEMIEDYLLYLKNEKGNAPKSCCLVLTGLRFFYTHILDRQIAVDFSLPQKPRKLPTVLSQQQVAKIIGAPKNLKHRLMLMTTYTARLRAGEVRRLKADHIDSQRMLLKVVGGKLGFIATLQTWDQKLNAHIHLHFLVAGEAVSKDGSCWMPLKRGYLFNERALSLVFRGKFMDLMKRACQRGDLKFAGNQYDDLKARLYEKPWIIDVRDPVKRPELVLEYLARYTHRVAIANSRIKQVIDGMVTFTFKNRKKGRTESLTITAVEFIGRFLLHSLPKRFVRIRHYGFLANRNRLANLDAIRQLMGLSDSSDKPVSNVMKSNVESK